MQPEETNRWKSINTHTYTHTHTHTQTQTLTQYHGRYFIDVIWVRNEKERYHIKSMSATDVELEFIESSNMFMNFRKNDFSHYWKVLYIDHNVLQANETNKVDFLKQHSSRKFDDNEDLFMIGIYQTTVVFLGYVHES